MSMDVISQMYVYLKKEITTEIYVQFIAPEYVEITRFCVKGTKKLLAVKCQPSATQEEQKQKEMMLEDSVQVTALPTAGTTKYCVKVKRIVTVV